MPINIEDIVYFYMAICAALLLFNIAYMLQDRGGRRRLHKRTRLWTREILAQLALMEKNGWAGLEERHKKKLQKSLSHINSLVPFHQAVMRLLECGHEEEVRAYLKAGRLVFQYLASEYGKKDQVTKAYYAYLMSVYRVSEGLPNDTLAAVLISYLPDAAIYCRENVLQALYALGNSEAVERAYVMIGRNREFHHVKLLSDGLASFRGDKEELAARLWARYQEFNTNLSVALIQFITRISGDYSEPFLELLQKEETGLEERLAIVRYFRKHPYEPAGKVLQGYARSSAEVYWELCALSASALSAYPGEETIKALESAIHDANWYVRHNAAASLAALKVPLERLQQVLDSGDRYAKEILQYMLK